MIGRADLDERVREWGLTHRVVEKDYVLGWVLWGIGTEERLASAWAFKGGTCLKKCYLETYRFSEDLDFTVLPDGPIAASELRPIVESMLGRVSAESGIEFDVAALRLDTKTDGRYTEGRLHYRGPLGARLLGIIRLDISACEEVVRPTELRAISHSYPDTLPEPASVRCYSFVEVFAEKIRAMGERGRPRDLYDVVNLFRRDDLRGDPDELRVVLADKCRTKGIEIPTFATLAAGSTRVELEAEWENMLAHQLPALPPFPSFWSDLEALFDWLSARAMPPRLEGFPMASVGGGGAMLPAAAWAPPATVTTWGLGVPLETVRFAAANHLCVRLHYQGTTRVIEPYSLRRTQEGNLLLHGIRVDNREPRAYRVDRIQGVEVTTQSFTPIYRVEFSAVGAITAAPASRPVRGPSLRPRSSGRSRTAHAGPIYVYECSCCSKRFRHSKMGGHLNAHKDRYGSRCSGRVGYLVDTEYH